MNYGLFYKVVSFNQFSVRTVHSAIQNTNLEWNEGKLYNQTTAVKRQTDVAWINDRNFLQVDKHESTHRLHQFIEFGLG